MAITISGAGITSAQIQADGIDGSKIADDVIDSEHLAADSIDAEHYAAGSVDTTAIAALDTLDKIKTYENKPHTETRKTSTYNEDGSFKEYSGTHTLAGEIDMCTHFTANPTDEADAAFVSLVAD